MPDAKLPSMIDDDDEGDGADATRVGAGAPSAAENMVPLKGYFTVVVGADPGRMFSLNLPTMVIGRGPECDVRLDSESISRKHARITRQAGHYTIEDLGSTNGTWVDGSPASPEPLKSGARIRFGNELIVRFSMLDDAEAALQQRLYEGVIQDTLTGAHNRRHFDRCLAAEVSQSAKFTIPIVLILIEVADMKGITDYYTQAGGDVLVRAVAKIVQDAARSEDTVARVSNDRFAVLARGLSKDEAASIGNKVRAAIERLDILLQTGGFSMNIQDVKCFVSIVQLADVPAPPTPESFFQAAVDRIERAKNEASSID